MAVLSPGSTPVSTTFIRSMPKGSPAKFWPGMVYFWCSPTVMVRISWVNAKASRVSGIPMSRTIAGAAAMAKAPNPLTSIMAESPKSGLASACSV